ncbi:MAG: glycosyltransferase [Terriglobales bacterium]
MKVLHIVGSSQFGGVYVGICIECRMAREHGIEPSVLTTDPMAEELYAQNKIRVVKFEGIDRPIRPWKDWVDARRLERYLREDRFEIVHTHTSKGGMIGRYAAWKAKVPAIIHTAHSFAIHEFSSLWARHSVAFLEGRAARWCDRIVVLNTHDEEFARKFCEPKKLVHLPNAIPTNRLGVLERADREGLRRQVGIPREAWVIGNICRLTLAKNLGQFLQVLAKLRAVRGRPVYGVLIGKGELSESLKGLAKQLGVADRVFFLGFRSDAVSWLPAMDVFLSTSRWEGMSRSLLEAMAAGKPVIATSIKGNRDCLLDGESGLLVPVGDVDATVRACRRVLEDGEFATTLGRRARDSFNASYSEPVFIRDMWERVYLPVLEHKKLWYQPQGKYDRQNCDVHPSGVIATKINRNVAIAGRSQG